MKRVIGLIIVICMLVATVPALAAEYSGTWHDCVWTLKGDTLYVSDEDLMVDDYFSIGGYEPPPKLAQEHSESIKRIVFEEGIVKIGYCTAGLINLEEVVIPASVEEMTIFSLKYVVDENNKVYSSLEGVLFNKDKTKLIKYPPNKTDKKYKMPDSVISVSENAFFGNKQLEEVVFGEGVKSVENAAFSGCESLKEVKINDNCEAIGKSAFLNCKRLETIELKNVKKIGEAAFERTGLKEVAVPESVEEMGKGVFFGCGELERVYVEEGVDKIPASCFSSSVKLKEVYLPDTVTVIGKNAFFQTAIGNENGETYIGKHLISYTGKGEYTVKAGTKSIACYAFEKSEVTHINLPEQMTFLGENTLSYTDSLTSVTLPESIETICDGAFSHSGIEKIYVGKNVCEISPSAFYECKRLEAIDIAEENEVYSSLDGVLFNKDKTKLIEYPEGKKDEEYIVPEQVLSIVTFNQNPFVKKVILPLGMTEITDRAFSGCSGIEEAVLGENIHTIGKNAFYKCEKLKKITFPKKLEVIDNGAFRNSGVEEIILSDSVRELGGSAFYECRSLRRIDMGEKIEKIGANAFCFCSALEKVYVPDSVLSIGDGAFQGCGMITEAYIGGGQMGNYLFMGDISLESVTLGDNVKNVGIGMFEECRALKKITIGDGAEIISQKALENCVALEKLHIGKNVKTIEASFFDVMNLSEITVSEENTAFRVLDGVLFTYDMGTLVRYPAKKEGDGYIIPEGVTAIGKCAFHNAINLKEVSLPDSLEVIDDQAFEECENIMEFVFPVGIKRIGNDAIHITGAKGFFYKGTKEEWDKVEKSSMRMGDLYGVDVQFNYTPVYVTVNGERISFAGYGQNPYIKNNRTLVPMRAIFEELGARVLWDDETKTAIGEKGETQIKIKIGEKALHKNGEAIALDCAAEITNNRTMVPVRAISEAFGCSVEWDNETKTVEITDN